MKTKLKQFKRLRSLEVSKTVSKVSKEATLHSLQLCTDPSVVHSKLPEGHLYWSMDHWRYTPLNQVVSFKVKLDRPIIDVTANPDDPDYDGDETEYDCKAMVNKTSISLLMQYFDDTEEKRQQLLDIFAEKPSSPYSVARHLPKGILKFYEDPDDESSGEWYYTPACEESLMCKMNFALPVWNDEEEQFVKTKLECKGDITETTINIFLKYCDSTAMMRDEIVKVLRAHGSDVDVSIQDLASKVGCGVFTKNKMDVWCWWLHDYPNLDFNDGEWSVDCDGVWSKRGVAVITLKHILDDDWDISKKLYPSGTLSTLDSIEVLRPYAYYDMVEIINKNRNIKLDNFLRDSLNMYDPIMGVIDIEDLASQLGYGIFTQNGKDSTIYWWSKNKGLEYIDDVWKCNTDDVVCIKMEMVGNVKVYDEPIKCTGNLNVGQTLYLLGKYKDLYSNDDESLLRLKNDPEKYVDLKECEEKTQLELDLDNHIDVKPLDPNRKNSVSNSNVNTSTDVYNPVTLAAQLGWGVLTRSNVGGNHYTWHWWLDGKGLKKEHNRWVTIDNTTFGHICYWDNKYIEKDWEDKIVCTGILSLEETIALLKKFGLCCLTKYTDTGSDFIDLDEKDIRTVINTIQKDTESKDTKQSGLLLESNGKYTQLDFTNTSDLINKLLNKLGSNTSDIVTMLLGKLEADLLIKDGDEWTKINRDKND